MNEDIPEKEIIRSGNLPSVSLKNGLSRLSDTLFFLWKGKCLDLVVKAMVKRLEVQVLTRSCMVLFLEKECQSDRLNEQILGKLLLLHSSP